MHAQFFNQFALARKAVQTADQQNAQQQFGINRGPTTGLNVTVFQSLPGELKTDVLVDEPQQMVFRSMIFQPEAAEQRF